eukprot:COSAG02_NODE_1938_length_10312_cov_16.495741_3_plen_226_part_00
MVAEVCTVVKPRLVGACSTTDDDSSIGAPFQRRVARCEGVVSSAMQATVGHTPLRKIASLESPYVRRVPLTFSPPPATAAATEPSHTWSTRNSARIEEVPRRPRRIASRNRQRVRTVSRRPSRSPARIRARRRRGGCAHDILEYTARRRARALWLSAPTESAVRPRCAVGDFGPLLHIKNQYSACMNLFRIQRLDSFHAISHGIPIRPGSGPPRRISTQLCLKNA